jgi:hypothetical protein
VVRVKDFHQTQNENWYEHYLSSEGRLAQMEDVIRQVESVALEYVSDETARIEIIKIVDNALRGVLK